ncbi:MAG: NAD(P)H-dependent oxidoreductase [Myxococcales bacterium]|nr:NAD(P)H-dependent oxidoreductase [Myxococcales bacterium]
MRKVLVVYCHPNPKSYTHAVLGAVEAGLRAGGAEIDRIDLHHEGFDPVLLVDERRRRRDLDKVEGTQRHRELLAWCDALVLIYPVWWGGFPAMLKGFIDRVFVSGLTYSFEGRPKSAVLPDGLMRGKEAHFFYTLDSPALIAWLDPGWWSNYFTVFKYCGFSTVRRNYLARLKLTSPETRAAWLREVTRRARRIAAA